MSSMNRKEIIVPEGVRYISEWDGYNLDDYNYPHILNKVLTGCGFTEYCLKNHQNIILVSPRKFLLENKEEQHPGEVYYAKNEIENIINYEKDVGKEDIIRTETSDNNEELLKSAVKRFKDDLWDYIFKECTLKNKPAKILVTYDSFRLVKEALLEHGIFDRFQVVVDEFQSIFIDARFKSTTEIELLYQLQDVQKLCFVSATPMIDEYLDRLDEFKNLLYYELDWETADPGRTKKPKLDVKFVYKSLNEELGKIILSYQRGKFESRYFNDSEGKMYNIESREAVFFLNSVKGICQAIRSNKLHLGDCNILCAKTEDNQKAVRKAFNDVLKKEYQDQLESGIIDKRSKTKLIKPSEEVIGKIPVFGEPHKMFTFCTRTVYLGADFYSTCARTFVFSDSNIDCLSVDISMDLEQILGRQRLDENPWKNSASLFIKTTRRVITKEEFLKHIEKKIEATESLLKAYNAMDIDKDKSNIAKAYQKMAITYHYHDDYVAVNGHSGSSLKPVFNNLMLVSEQRAFDIQQVDYADRFSVYNALCEKSFDNIKEDIKTFSQEFNELPNVVTKLKKLVEFGESPGVSEEDLEMLFQLIPGKYGDYYKVLGPEVIKSCSYHETTIKNKFNMLRENAEMYFIVSEKIYGLFEVGKRYTKTDIKSSLKDLYKNLGYNKTAKATDLEEYFILKKYYSQSDKKVGFEIIAKK